MPSARHSGDTRKPHGIRRASWPRRAPWRSRFGEEAAWIERVVVSTEPLRDEEADAGDILGDLHDILGGAAADADLHKLLEERSPVI
ncbi:MAG: hypothetical protein R3B51_02005 [Thermodesulfobacteriota bacterium]